MGRKRDTTVFDFKDIKNNDISVYCWTTHVYDGFIHHAQLGETKATVKWYNRTWESFEYESAMRALFNKMFKDVEREYMLTQVQCISDKMSETCKKQLEEFTALYNGLSDKAKEKLADAVAKNGIEASVSSVEEAKALVKLTAAFDAMELLK